MQDITRFRTALAGFNRSDVARYIETSAKQHKEELSKWKDELSVAQAEKLAALEKVKELSARLESVEAGAPAPVATPAEIPADPAAMELAAYRRAEQAERAARQRIHRQMERLSDLMQDVTSEQAGSSQEMQALIQSMVESVEKLQTLFARVGNAFSKTESAMEELKNEIAD
jgi:chromosome segregation ATPase